MSNELINNDSLFDWEKETSPLLAGDGLFEEVMIEELPNILVKSVGKNKVFPVWSGKEITRRIRVNNSGKLVRGEKKLTEGEFIYITDRMEPPKYIVRDILSALAVFNETRSAVAVYMEKENLSDVVERFPEAKVITGAQDKWIVSAYPDKVIEISKFGNNKDEQKLFKGKKFKTVKDYYLAGGDINIMLFTGKKTRMAPLWWRQKRALRPSWIIEGMIPEGPSIVTVFSPSGVGKTFFIVAGGLTVASGGGDFYGHKANGGKVLYLCGEGDAAVSVRIQCWLEQHNIKDVSKVKFFLDNIPFSFDNDSDYSDFITALEEKFISRKPDIIIVDTMNLFMEGDENSTQEASSFVKRLKTFTVKYECTIVLVHHTGQKEEGRERGSSAFKGAIDSEIRLSDVNGIKKVEQTKNRNGAPFKTFYLKFEEHDVEFYRDKESGETIRDCILVQTEAPKDETTTIHKEFLINFCVGRALKGEDWMMFTYDDLLDFGKEYFGDKASVVLNPTQKTKTLGILLKSHIIVETDGEKQEKQKGRRSKYSGICYRLNEKSTIAEIKDSITSAENY